jgi:hypothetical protein
LESATRRKNLKGTSVCLGILNSNSLCSPIYLQNVHDKYIKTIESIISGDCHEYSIEDEKSCKDIENNKIQASNLLMKIADVNSKSIHYNEKEKGDFSSFKDPLSTECSFTYEKPGTIKTCLFQLNESNDMNRIVFLLETVLGSQFSKELLANVVNLFGILKKMIKRYSNGDFRFDNNENTKYCVFQNKLMKCFLMVLELKQELIFDIEPEIIGLFSQVMEECCLYIIENLSNYDKKNDYEYKLFFGQSLKIFELLIANHQGKNLEELVSSIKSIIERIKMYFTSNTDEQDFDIEDLGIFSQDLKLYYQDIKELLIRTKSIADIVSSGTKTKLF